MSTYADELYSAVAAVRAAARVCRAVQKQLVEGHTLEKDDRSPVTVADFASQAIVCATLGEALPDDPIVGEEDAGELREGKHKAYVDTVVAHVNDALGKDASSQEVLDWIDRGNAEATPGSRYWTIDPIDGTKGFLRGDQYAIALGLIEDNQVVVGALACPNLPFAAGDGEPGTLLVARRGEATQTLSLWGCDVRGSEVSVTDIADPAGARFCESFESGHSDQDASVLIAKRLGITAEPVRMDSQAKYASVARGDASIYLRLPTRKGYEEKIWDHAAGLICVEQAGGKVTDIDGNPLDFSRGRTFAANRGVVATNGEIHDALVEAIGEEFVAP